MSAPTVSRRELFQWNAAQAGARIDYDALKADHALPYGCDNCTVGSAVPVAPGWEYHERVDLLVCVKCKGLMQVRKRVALAEREANRREAMYRRELEESA